jgi:hypothetical protein
VFRHNRRIGFVESPEAGCVSIAAFLFGDLPMAKNAGNAGMGRPPKLRADAETLLKLNHFGLKGLASKETARRLGVHDGTLRRLFAREPEAEKAFIDGHRERRALVLGTGPEAANMTCPRCGNAAGAPDDIVITGAELADARRKFEDLVNRHIAAWEAEQADTGSQ